MTDALPDGVVPIPPNAALWRILATEGPWRPHPVEGPMDRGLPTVVLEWGWDAGLTAEDLAHRAADCPRGKASVRTTLEMAKELHAELGALIARLEQKVVENPPPPKTPTAFDLIMLYVMEECDRADVKGSFDPRRLIDDAPWDVREQFHTVVEASATIPANPGESVRDWRDRILATIK